MSPGWRVGRELLASAFPDVEVPEARPERRRGFPEVIDELRAEHYNATITHFEPTHSDLWVLRVKPDHGSVSHLPGQYASLGLGYWEERIDSAVDPDLDAKFDKLIRRSYSISCRIFDEHGYLSDDWTSDELEFYIVLVPPTPDNVPGLTPRLALKKPGDRIYLGPKVAGRYTLAPVTDPAGTVILLSTGTGEAPHNAMVTELLRKGHHGPIVSAVTVREWADLGYTDQHRELEKRYPNYTYLPLPTRESDVPKRYIQDLITADAFEKELGVPLDAATTHVFLCGNPAMIGLPEEHDGEERFPEVTGVVELLTDRGFTLDRRNQPGNIHFEEYW
ncbi:MAG: ferredoxin--NADP reductase [Acidimicrobiales bacterium]|nr:ferredoxin--NADP reductase [Acidimicrobiales bacterium]